MRGFLRNEGNSVARVFDKVLTSCEFDEWLVVVPVGFFQGGEVGRSNFVIRREVSMGVTPSENWSMK